MAVVIADAVGLEAAAQTVVLALELERCARQSWQQRWLFQDARDDARQDGIDLLE